VVVLRDTNDDRLKKSVEETTEEANISGVEVISLEPIAGIWYNLVRFWAGGMVSVPWPHRFASQRTRFAMRGS
jgi:hypothetical protein